MKTQPVTFAAMTDLHLDIMHDGMMRIDAFLDAAQKGATDDVCFYSTIYKNNPL